MMVLVGAGSMACTALAQPARNTDGFLVADAPREWSFPEDFGRHPGYQIEWWYYTGNLVSEDGREFGYQLTFFRNELAPGDHAAELMNEVDGTHVSPWRGGEYHFAHFAISDITSETFFHADVGTRGHPSFASAADDTLDVHLLGWRTFLDEHGDIRLIAERDGHAIDLTATIVNGPILHGPGGVSPKGDEFGQASYYHSITRLATSGTVTTHGEAHEVSGLSWMDQEFSSNQLSDDQTGWDWFALHLDDGRDVMIYRLRDTAGGTDYAFATIVPSPGEPARFTTDEVSFEPGGTWTSPDTGGAYPREWTLTVGDHLTVVVRSRFDGQEVRSENTGDVNYLEAAVEVLNVEGVRLGTGYMELTGYDKPLNERL
ncbi:MAG: lipocalin-like domain-containing protein [Planctomycetota bacterium]